MNAKPAPLRTVVRALASREEPYAGSIRVHAVDLVECGNEVSGRPGQRKARTGLYESIHRAGRAKCAAEFAAVGK